MTATGGNAGSADHTVKILANIFISFIGAGVLGLPFAFKEAGILEGIVVMTTVGIISVKAMLLIVDCKYKLLQDKKVEEERSENMIKRNSDSNHCNHDNGLVDKEINKVEMMSLLDGDEEVHIVNKQVDSFIPEMSYGDVGYYAIGHIGRVLVDVAIVVSQTGFCCAYLIFITENLSDYMPHMKLIHWLFVLLPPLCLLTLLRHLGSLAFTSLLAQCSNLLAFAVVFWFDFDHLHNVEIHPKKISIKGLPFFLAISIYCYEGAGMILSLEGSIVEEKKYKFKKYFVSTMCIVTSLYISFGACGYLSFGKETRDIITLNLPKGESLDFAMIVKSFLCLALFFTYPVMMFPVMKVMESYLIPDAHQVMWKGNVLRVVMVALTGVVVLIIPNFANLMALVGATCCTMLAFILPGLFHMSIFKGSLSICDVVIDWTLVFMGIVGAIIGTADALQRLHKTPEMILVTTAAPSAYNMTKAALQPSLIWSTVNTTP